MNNREIKAVNLSIMSIGFKLTALEKALTADQKIIFEASLKESRDLVQGTLSASLSPEERRILLQVLGQK